MWTGNSLLTNPLINSVREFLCYLTLMYVVLSFHYQA